MAVNRKRRGGGGGLTFGPETNQFTSTSQRDTYAAANSSWLATYDANPSFRRAGHRGEHGHLLPAASTARGTT